MASAISTPHVRIGLLLRCYGVTVLRKGTLPPLLKEEKVSRHFAIQLQSRGDHSAIGLRFDLYRRFDVSRSCTYRRFMMFHAVGRLNLSALETERGTYS